MRAEPGSLADEQFARAAYAPTARYALPAAGTSASVRALTRDVIRTFYSQHYHPASTTLVFAGDVTVAGAVALAESLFGDWRGERSKFVQTCASSTQPAADSQMA